MREKGIDTVSKKAVIARIEGVGIVPAIRVASAEDALFAAKTISSAGIPIAEITLTVPGAAEVIANLRRTIPEMIVGAGTVLDKEAAQRCIDAGALFLTSPGLVLEVVEFAVKNQVVVFPGALTPSEVITAWKVGADFVKVYPCSAVNGDKYIRALKVPLPQIALIASGGVNQQTASDFILAGASALGIGTELIPRESIQHRQDDRIRELARRFSKIVRDARAHLSTYSGH